MQIISGKLQNLVPYNQSSPMPSLEEGFELLGIKWLPCLSAQHAKELTPLEIGDKNWKNSIRLLTSGEMFVINIFHPVCNAQQHMMDSRKEKDQTYIYLSRFDQKNL